VTPAIAIVGMACRYPDARTPEELWQTVLARRRAFRRLPEERLRLSDYAPRDDADCDSIYPIEAAVLEDYAFDRARFRIPPAAVASADLTHWLALDVATDALADAGLLAPSGLLTNGGLSRSATAVIVGNTLTGEFSRAGLLRIRWPYVRRQLDAALAGEGFDAPRRASFLERFEDAYKAPFPPPDEETLAGGLANTIAGRICNHYDLHGGGYTVDGACASSLLAVSQACQLLASHEVDTVIAGGVDLSLDPFELVGFARNGALSKSVMRVFDARSDGFWPGEGSGFVVLRRADDAVAMGQRVRALIRGWGVSSDGAGGLTRPTVTGQRAALEQAYRRAGFGPGSVPLFEAHGTGTAVGDPIEVEAIAEARRAAGIEVPAVVGSIKANIGHTKAAAGLAGLIKAVLALEHQVLPAATGCEQVHPAILAHQDAVTVSRESRVWPEAWQLRAGVGAMGFGGINVHLALEGAVAQRRGGFDAAERRLLASEPDAELFPFAASDHDSLRRQVADMAALAPRLSRAELADAAAALAARPRPDARRAMVVAATPAELAERLGLLLDRFDLGEREFIDPLMAIGAGMAGRMPRIAILFPGQAARVGLDGGVWARRFTDLAALWHAAELPEGGDPTATEIAQPAIMAGCLAGLVMLARLGIEATVAVGHSVGELAALHWAGAFDGAALRRLARGRGRAMADLSLPGGAMALIGDTPEATETLLRGVDAVIACRNAARECVISGATADIATIVERAAARGIWARSLAVSHAFHSRFVAPAAPAMRDLAAAETFAPLRRAVISTVTGAALPEATDLGELLTRQVTAPVRFAEALACASRDADLLIEVGPGHGLTRIAATPGGPPCIALDTGGSSLAGLLLAAGAAFVLGAPVRVPALFADRFVRAFDLDRPRRFLANPCEAAPVDAVPPPRPARSRPAPAEAIPTRGTPLEVIRGLLARRLELDPALIELNHRLLGDLHLNSIAVGQIVGEAARLLGRAPPATPTNFAAATVAEAAAALDTAGLLTDDASERFPPGVASWIRCFATQYMERPLPALHESPLAALFEPTLPALFEPPPPALIEPAFPATAGAAARRWRVFAAAGHPLAETMARSASCGDEPPDAVAVCLSACPAIDDLPRLLAGTRCALASGKDTLLLVLQDRGGGGAFARCLSLEHPRQRVLVLDLPFAHADAASWVIAEAARAVPGYQEAHYDATGQRRVPVLRPLPDARPGASGYGLGADDVVLVSGGAKGIGAECALALARRTGARLALLGRSAANAPAVTASLTRLRAAGVIARYEPADVTDRDAVAAAVARLEAALGPVTGVLHAAGVNQPTPVERLDDATFAATVAVKVAGLRHLLSAVAPERPRLLVGFGSIIARIGLPGEAHYALANEWMGQLIERFAADHPACRVLVPEWSVWSGVGMGETLGVVETLARQGVAALAADPAAALFASLATAQGGPTSVVISGRFGDPPTVDLARPPLSSGRFLERVPVFYPGIELVAEVNLTPSTDPWLSEHALAGTSLFPAVLGLEAMVQAAAALAGRVPDTTEQIAFNRPVATGPDGGRLRIAALRGTDERVEVVLRCDETGFQAEHFHAIAVVGQPRAEPAPAHPAGSTLLPMSADELYTRMLFHTGRFRRLAGYSALSATSCIAHIRPDPEVRWFPERAADDLLLGDPAARDAAVHALQACIPHRRVLPIGVERIHFGRLESNRAYVAHARETSRDGDRFVFDLEIREADGTLAERWDGLALRAIEPLPTPADWPAALAGPFIERRLGELIPHAAPRVALVAGHAGQAPDTDAMLRGLLGPDDTVRRRPDGKPEARAGVSASHAGNLGFAVAAKGLTGCDIEPILQRTEFAWRDLLGSERFELASLIAREGNENFAAAATRVWGATEALKKAGASVAQAPLSLRRIDAGWVVLTSGEMSIATWVGSVEHQPVAIATATGVAARQTAAPAYSYRHIVGFRDTNLVGNVYFVNHLEWQGRCREMFLRDKAPGVLSELADGLALVTTRCSCDYLAELTAFDEVRLEMRLKAITDNRIAFAFEYWRGGESGGELVATGEQEVACMRTINGRKVPSAVPAALLSALRPYAVGASAG
jgi:enediyne polyketide synthase